MTVFGTIYDNQTNAFLPGASVQVTDQVGNPTGPGIAADDNGWFSLVSPVLDQGGKVLVSNVGYKSALVDPTVITSRGAIGLDESADLLNAAIVTAKAPIKTNYAPWLLAGGAGLLLLSTDKKNKKAIGATSDYSGYILPIGIVGAAGFLLYKLFGKGGWLTNPTGSAANNSTTATAAAQSSAETVAKETAAGKGPTISAVTAASIANSIYALGLKGDPYGMNDQIDQVNNLADVALVSQYFGTKYLKMPQDSAWGLCALFDIDCTAVDFPTFFRTFSLQADPTGAPLNTINQYFSSMGINYSF